VKALAADVKAFFDDPALWDNPSPAAWYIDDLDTDFEALFVDLAVKVEVPEWPIAWHGGGMSPPEGLDHPFVKHDGFATNFKQWMKGRTHRSVVVTLPIADAELLTNLCAMHKWKVT